MKRLFIILLLATSCTGGQSNKSVVDTPTDSLQVNLAYSSDNSLTVENKSADKTFISIAAGIGYYHAVYIDRNKNSEHRKMLTDFSFHEEDNKTYLSVKSSIEEKIPGSFNEQKMFDLPQNWLPLYQYKDKYYLYAPSDWGNAHRCIINSREFISWYMEGPYPFPFSSVKKLSNHQYILTVLNPFESISFSTQIIIHIIDPATKLAVFEYTDWEDDYRYQLYVSVDHADSFDLVVNYCEDQKVMEFDFDKIDYAKLIKSN